MLTRSILENTFNFLLDARDLGITSFSFTEDSGAVERHSVEAWIASCRIHGGHMPAVTDAELARVRAGLRAERRAVAA